MVAEVLASENVDRCVRTHQIFERKMMVECSAASAGNGQHTHMREGSVWVGTLDLRSENLCKACVSLQRTAIGLDRHPLKESALCHTTHRMFFTL